MVFTSAKFLIFLILTVCIYYSVPVKARGYILLASSVVFYCIAGVRFLPFIGAAMLVSYGTARYISSQYAKADAVDKADPNKAALKDKAKKNSRRMMWIAVLFLLGVLCYTKFTGMFLRLMSSAMGLEGDWAAFIIVPLGISYYTFSTVGYVLDVYWKRYDAEKNFFHYAAYVIYFPHILQGPIARYNRLGVQLFAEHRFDYTRICYGIQLMIWGFFQKLVIADRLNLFVSTVYGDVEGHHGAMLLVATLFYAVQIYTDFAGCVNIARGISQIFDITLEDNFNQPYFSKSVAEFWRRWHITLGAWFKDYLCMPIAVWEPVKKLSKFMRQKYGRTAGKNTVTIASLIAVWIATGVWHGTGLNYILWAVWQGGIIAISTLLEPQYKKWKAALKINETSWWWEHFCIVRTFILTGIIPRIITRAASLGAALGIFKRILTQFAPWELVDGTIFTCGMDRPDFWLSLICIFLLYKVSSYKERGVQIRETIAKQNIVIRWLIYYGAIMAIVIFGIYGPGYDATSFAYMNF